MSKKTILLSWIGLDSDFKPQPPTGPSNPNLDGPNITMHHHFEDRTYQKHIILYTEDTKSQVRMQQLRDYFKADNATWPVEFRPVRMADPDVINIQALQQKMVVLMAELRDYAMIDILVTTGTKTMHTVWHLIHLEYKDRTRLIQVRPAQYTDDGRPELLTITFDASNLPATATAMVNILENPIKTEDRVPSTAIKPAYELASKLALADRVPALILGKSGSGKQLLARFIHQNSPRKHHLFKVVHCKSLSDELLWIELFGQAKRGNIPERKGVLETCKGGTVLLDEIGHLSPALQQALLLTLEHQEVMPMDGGGEVRAVDVRLLAATGLNLPEACEGGWFRWDLYYRLAVVELDLPSLTAWSLEDREALWEHLVHRKQAEFKKAAPLLVSKEVKNRIFQYPFPGNVQEMENLVARLYVVAEGRALMHDLPGSLNYSTVDQSWLLEQVERVHITKALHFQGYKQAATAEILGIVVNTLKEKCKRYGIGLK